MRVGLGVRVEVGSAVRLGEGVWVLLGTKAEVETTVARGAASVVGAGLAGARTQPAAAMTRGAIRSVRFKRSRPGFHSRGGSNPQSPNPPTVDLFRIRLGASSRTGF